jgi:uncharacterized DUF497 family protein
MRYSWDEEKNRRNLELHAITFEDAARIFEGPTVEEWMTALITANGECMPWDW